MKILVTGANGYIGHGIIKELSYTKNSVIATDIQMEKEYENIFYKEANLFEIENPYEYFMQPDIVLHLAWRDGFKHDSINHLKDLFQHFLFIEKLMMMGVKRICVMGSVHEVGFYEGSVDESTPTNPQSYYGIAKNSLRQCVELLSAKYRVKYQWIRGFYIVGNVEKGCSVFSKLAEAENNGKKVFPFTNGVNQFDFLDYDDFCKKVCEILLQDKVLGIINCCSGIPERIGDRVEKYITDHNYRIKLKYGAFPERPYDAKAIWGNTKKLDMIIKDMKIEKQS